MAEEAVDRLAPQHGIMQDDGRNANGPNDDLAAPDLNAVQEDPDQKDEFELEDQEDPGSFLLTIFQPF